MDELVDRMMSAEPTKPSGIEEDVAMTKTLTLAIMDPPYESARSTTAMRLVDAALRRGIDVNVFAYEGAVRLTIRDQQPHPNPVHQSSVEEENHPTTKEFVAGLFRLATESGAKLEWVNCGLCVDERGAGNWIDGPRRGGPPGFHAWTQASDQTLVIPTR
jgi:tRNA 2-thiouridine synthesizing protein D